MLPYDFRLISYESLQLRKLVLDRKIGVMLGLTLCFQRDKRRPETSVQSRQISKLTSNVETCMYIASMVYVQ